MGDTEVTVENPFVDLEHDSKKDIVHRLYYVHRASVSLADRRIIRISPSIIDRPFVTAKRLRIISPFDSSLKQQRSFFFTAALNSAKVWDDRNNRGCFHQNYRLATATHGRNNRV